MIEAGIKIAGYRITETIYVGTRTIVYRGIREIDNLPVILKLMRKQYPTLNEIIHFRHQYNICKDLDIPGVVKFLSLENYENTYVLIMEDFGGISLKEYVKQYPKQKLPISEFLPIAIQVTSTLSQIHNQSIIHKDIKPANILINNEKKIQIIDFSIASLLPKEIQTCKYPNVLEGTLAYLSPEQTGRMNRIVDYRSDFYSLGITFYEVLIGELPFISDDAMELVHCHLAKFPVYASKINPEIPIIISDIIEKLIAKNAEERYQTALGLKHDLETCLSQLSITKQIKLFPIAQRDISNRFIIPQKLYGREQEVKNLLNAFARVSEGATELILVAGFSGIGKTAIVNEVHKPIIKQRGYFIKGKYDQFQRDIPLFAFIQAFRDLIGQLVSESDTQLEIWKQKIIDAVGENGQVIIEVIPELENIIGKQAPLTELNASAAQNRFHLVFKNFIQVFASQEHPLVIFIDDLQWADSASLKLMQLLLNQSKTGYLLIIGAYRDSEVFSAHPLILTLQELEKNGININTITLQSLTQFDINQLVADTLNCQINTSSILGEIIFKKTKGNPFFATQLLKSLYEDGLITFEQTLGIWQCDISKVRLLTLSDDVVEFIAAQLQKLPESTQSILKLAACIGAQFDLATLAIVTEKSHNDVATDLWKALQEGLILPTSETYKFYQNVNDSLLTINYQPLTIYKFLHDRIQQAAYSLIVEDQKQVTHLQIGQLLLRNSSSIQQDERLFEIVNHLNIGISLIVTAVERKNLTQLNLLAGRKAKISTAYGTAIKYLETGISLLPPNPWESHYGITLSLYQEITEASYLNTDFKQMEKFANLVLQYANTLLDTIPIYVTKMLALRGQGYPLKSLNVGLEVLQRLEIKFPQKPTLADIEQANAVTNHLWKGNSPLSLLDLPPMENIDHLAVMNIMTQMVPSSYFTAPNLMLLLIFKQVEYSIVYGNCPISVCAYADYGIILCGVMGELEAGYEFGELALKLLEKLQCKTFKSRAFFIVCYFIRHWRDPLCKTLPTLLEGYQSGLETGDIESAAMNAYAYCYHAYFAGRELTGLALEIAAYCSVIDSLKQQSMLYSLQIVSQVVLNLLGNSQFPERLTGTIYNAEQWLPVHEANQDRVVLFYWQINQIILWYLFEHYQQAAQQSIQTQQYLDAAVGTYLNSLYYFYDALIQLAFYKKASEEEKQQILQKVEANEQKISIWARLAPCNHQHHWELVAAQRYDVLGNRAQAIEFYDRAIASAKANGYIQEEALAKELTAKFYLDWGKEKIAQNYMQEAYYCYVRWGALAKVKDLEIRYSQLLQPILQQEKLYLDPLETIASYYTSSDSSSISEALDFTSILKAAQVISSSIELDEVIVNLTRIILENSGADKSALILLEDDIWQVRAITSINPQGRIETILNPQQVDICQDIPKKLIYYVKNTQEIVVINRLETKISGVIGEYMLKYQPQSVLCIPISNQGSLIGILYLENKLTQQVFTRDRLTIVNFLCTQAAISLKNAQLYTNLQSSEARFQRLADNAPGMIYQFQLSPDGIPKVNYVSPGCYEIYEVSPEQILTDINNLMSPIHPEDIAHYQKSITISAQTLEMWEYEGRIITLSGKLKWIQAASRPVKQADGTIIWDGLLLDVTERKKAEAAAQQKSIELEQALQNLQKAQLQIIQSEKMSALGNLVAGVAHEINNPIGFIAGNIEPASEGIQDLFNLIDIYQKNLSHPSKEIELEIEKINLEYLREDLPNLISSMKEGVQRIRSISNSLRTFSRADKEYKIAFNIHEGIDSTILILKHRLKANENRPGIQIITNYGNIPKIGCFPGQLNQVFMNLLANAIDALEEYNIGRSFSEILSHPNCITITTSIKEDKTEVLISIKDNGKGMTKEIQQCIFDHLFTTKAVGKGTGLGLAIARQIIVEKHGGSIDVNSLPGEGAEFLITIPCENL